MSNEYTTEFTDFCVLPYCYDGELSIRDVTVNITATTAEGEYRCRRKGTKTITVRDDEGDIDFYYSDDSREDWSRHVNGTPYPQSTNDFYEGIGSAIWSLFPVSVPHGKYPEVSVRLDSDYYYTNSEDHDTDRGCGSIFAEYEIVIHIYTPEEKEENHRRWRVENGLSEYDDDSSSSDSDDRW